MSDIIDSLARSRTSSQSVEFDATKFSGPLFRGSTSVEYGDAIIAQRERIMQEQLANTPDPEASKFAWEKSKAIASVYGEEAETVFANLEQYEQRFFGEGVTYKGDLQAIWDVGVAQAKSLKMGRLYSEMNGWDVFGLLSGKPSPERQEEIKLEINKIKGEMGKLMLDITPRDWTTRLGKMVAGAVPYTASMAAQAALVGGAVALTGATVGAGSPALWATLKTAAITTFGMVEGTRVMAGLTYGEMIDNGIEHEVASKLALPSGIFRAAVEQVIGIEGFVSGGLSRVMTAKIVDKMVVKAGLSGILVSAGTKMAASMAVGSLSEGMEEATQTLIDGLFNISAQSITEEGSIQNPVTIRKIAMDAAEAAAQGFVVSIFLGLPTNVSMAIQDKKAAVRLADIAPSMSKEDFRETGKASGVFKGPGVSEEEEIKRIDAVHDKATARKAEAAAKAAEDTRNIAKEGKPGDIARTDDGRIYTQYEVTASTEGGNKQSVNILAGDNQSNTIYGELQADIDYEANTITIKGGEADANYVSALGEVMDTIASRYPGMKIQLDHGITDPAILGAYEGLVERKGETPYEGLTVEEAEDDNIVETALREQGFEERFIEPTSKLLGAFSAVLGTSKNELFKTLAIVNDPKGESFKASMWDSMDHQDIAKTVAQASGVQVRSTDSSMLNIAGKTVDRAVFIFEKGGAAEGFTTLAHELGHDFRSVLSKMDPNNPYLKKLELIYGVKDGAWNVTHDEQFVDDMLEYWRGGKPDVTAEQKTIFDRIGDFLKAVIGSIKDRLLPETREALDGLFAKAKSIEAGEIEVKPGDSVIDAWRRHPHINAQSRGREKLILKAAANGMDVLTLVRNENFLKDKASGYLKSLPSNMQGSPRAQALKNGSWAADPQLVAEIKAFSGIPLTQSEKDLLTMAAQESGFDVRYSLSDSYEARRERHNEYTEARLRDSLIEDLTKEELQYLVLHHPLTGIGSLRAYENDIKRNGGKPMRVQASLDADSLKFMNDLLGHDAGDKMLVAIAEALDEGVENAEANVYHKSGDEFLAQGNDIAEVQSALSAAIEKIASAKVTGKVDGKPGYSYELTNIGLSVGYDNDGNMANADVELQKNKEEREANGKRTRRGDYPSGLTIIRDSDGKRLGESEARALLGLTERRGQELQEEAQGEQDPYTGILKDGEGNASNIKMLFSKLETGSDSSTEEYAKYDARNYKTYQEWIAASYPHPEYLTDADHDWLKERYDAAHRNPVSKRRFKNKGDFVKFLREKDNLASFVREMAMAIRDRGKSDINETRAARIENAISKTPEWKRMVDNMMNKGKSPSPKDKAQALSLASKHEGIYKYLYAQVQGDQNLAHEAMDDLSTIPELVKHGVVADKGTTIQGFESIIDALRGTDLGERLRDGTITLEQVREFIDLNNDQWERDLAEAKKLGKEEAKMATELGKQKLKELKDKIKARDAAKRLEREMKKIRAFIMRKPSSRVDLAYAIVIETIQEFIEKGLPLTKEELARLKTAGSFMYARNPATGDQLAAQSFEYIWAMVADFSAKNEGQWTVDELRDLAGIIDSFSKEGRMAKRNMELAFGYHVKGIRAAISADLKRINKAFIGKDGKPLTDKEIQELGLMKGSEEDTKRQKGLNLAGIQFDADRPDAWIKKYLGKTAYTFMFETLVQNDRRKLENYDRRVKPINEHIAKTGLASTDKLFRKIEVNIGIGPEGTNFTITGSELVGIHLLIGTKDSFNPYQRDAFIYGNLFSDAEKNVDGTEGMKSEKSVNDYMIGKYNEKLNALLEFVDKNMTDEERELAELMLKSTDNYADWYRFADAMYTLTNKEPKAEKFYFPIVREGLFDEKDDEILSELKNFGVHEALNKGMSIERKNIQPRNQKTIQYDAMKVFYNSVAKQEHLIEMGPYIKQLKGVFQNTNMSESLSGQIRLALGQKANDYITNQIDTITNPNAFKEKASGDDMLSFFKGSMVIGNLAWRWSSVLMQMITSPLPALSKAPLDLMQVAAEAYIDPIQFYKKIEEQSAILRHRQLTPEQAALEERIEQGLGTKIDRFAQAGMKGLVWADRHSVAIVWESIRRNSYKKQYAKMTEAQKADPAKMAYIDQRAKDDADLFVQQTQPTSEEQYRAPMYRDPNAYKQLILQFTQPLNVIYNNLRHDVPDMVKEQHIAQAVGMISAYAISGVAISAVAVLRGRGPEDDDEEKWARYWLHALTSQFTESIPLVGQIITSLTKLAIVGDNESWMRNDTNMPATDFLARGIEGLFSDNAKVSDIAWNAAKGLGLMAGAPVKAVEEYWKLASSALEGF